MAPPVTAEVLDVYGNLVTGDGSNVTLTLASGPAGASISGTATEAASGGIATFAGIFFTKVGTYTFQVADGALTPATSTSFNVYAAQASQLAFSQQPTNAIAGATIEPPLTVDVEDGDGNLIVTDNSSVTLAITPGTPGSGPSAGGGGGAILGGTLTVDAVNGVATFGDLSLSMVGSYTLTATDAALQAATSSSFSITGTPSITWPTAASITYGTALSGAQLDAAASFDGTAVAGTFVYTPAAETVLHAGANQTLGVVFTPTDTADYTTVDGSTLITVDQATPIITWTKPANMSAGAALSAIQLDATANVAGTLVYAPPAGTVLPAGLHTLSGVFTPTDIADYTTADGSVQVNVGPSIAALTANGPVVTQKPLTLEAQGVTADSPATIRTVYFYADTLDTGVFNAKDRLLGTGKLIAQTDNYALTISTASLPVGADYFFARALDSKGEYSSVVGDSAVITPAAPAKLVFSAKPANTTAGSTMAAVVVKIEDKYGNVETSEGSAVSLGITSGPASGSFSEASTSTVDAVDGVATFSNLTLDIAGDYTLTAADPADELSDSKSNSFKISPGAVATVAFVKQPPASVGAGKTISPALTVVVKDACGNVLGGQSVKLTIASGPAGAALLGGISANTSGEGVATFGGVWLRVAGTYTWIASVGPVEQRGASDSLHGGGGTGI